MCDLTHSGNNDKENTNAFSSRTHSFILVNIFFFTSFLVVLLLPLLWSCLCIYFAVILSSPLLNGKRHARSDAMGIMKITLWSRNDTWEHPTAECDTFNFMVVFMIRRTEKALIRIRIFYSYFILPSTVAYVLQDFNEYIFCCSFHMLFYCRPSPTLSACTVYDFRTVGGK